MSTTELSRPHLEALYALARELLRLEDYDALLDVVVERSLDILRAERGFLVLGSGDELDFRVVRNWRRDELEGGGEPVSRTIVADVLKRREPLLIEDAASDPRFSETKSVHRHRIRSVLAAPLAAEPGGEPVGALYLETHLLRHLFGPRELDLFRRILELSERALERSTRLLLLEERNRELEQALPGRCPEILTRDPGFLEILDTVARVAQSEATVLIQGPSGTGKELVARALHRHSRRARQPFVPVNCGAISAHLIESELFGHRRGAFTGAERSKAGLLKSADGGTLFLDEVGELPLDMQVKLLRAVQFGEVRPVGASQPTKVDLRFVAATNRDLQKAITERSFRDDLFFRLSVVPIELPPLAKRRGDALLLFYHFLHRFAARDGRPVPAVTAELEAALDEYSWPGNVRELENEVERLLAVNPEGVALDRRHFSPRLWGCEGAPSSPDPESLAGQERALIRDHLERAGGNKTRAARNLGISREGLRQKMKRLGIG